MPPAPGSICHISIPAPDLAKAKAFYTRVFGWTVIDSGLPGAPYAMWECENMGGGFDSNMKVAGVGGVNVAIAVEDIPAKLKEIEAAGGTIIKPKTRISDELGHYAVFKDPNGNHLSIWSKA